MAARKTSPTKRRNPPDPMIEVRPGDIRPVGRPPMPFDPFIAKVFLEEVREGRYSVRRILDNRPNFYPGRTTIWKWLRENPDFAVQYAEAKQDQVESYVDDTVTLADEATPETSGVKALQIKVRQWTAERLNAKKYGPAIQHDHVALVQTSNASLFDHLDTAERAKLREIITNAHKRQEAAEINARTHGRQEPKQIEGKAKRRA